MDGSGGRAELFGAQVRLCASCANLNLNSVFLPRKQGASGAINGHLR
jgi:hypothetical protein